MNYIDLLKESAENYSSIVCLGLDPVIEDIPETAGTPGQRIYTFYEKILNKLVQNYIFPGAVKPNYAFYAQYGIDGIIALEKIINIYKAEKIPVILDYMSDNNTFFQFSSFYLNDFYTERVITHFQLLIFFPLQELIIYKRYPFFLYEYLIEEIPIF